MVIRVGKVNTNSLPLFIAQKLHECYQQPAINCFCFQLHLSIPHKNETYLWLFLLTNDRQPESAHRYCSHEFGCLEATLWVQDAQSKICLIPKEHCIVTQRLTKQPYCLDSAIIIQASSVVFWPFVDNSSVRDCCAELNIVGMFVLLSCNLVW